MTSYVLVNHVSRIEINVVQELKSSLDYFIHPSNQVIAAL